MPIAGVNRPSLEISSLPNDRARVFQCINDNIDFIDQAFAQTTFTAQHGTEVLIPNPYGASSSRFPVAVLSSYALDSTTGLPVAIAGITIGAPRADKRISLTVQYAPPLGYCDASNTADLSVGNGAFTAVVFNQDTTLGTALSRSGNTIIVNVSGVYQCRATQRWAATSANSRRIIDIMRNGSAVHEGQISLSAATINPATDHARMMLLAAGDSMSAQVFQDSGGALNLLGGATTGVVSRLEIQAMAATPATTALVKAIFISGS